MKGFTGSTTGSRSSRNPLRSPTKWQVILSTIGVSAVAVAQPILDLLGRSPDFFIARAAQPGDVVLLAIVLGLVLPLALTGLVLLGFTIGPNVGKVVHVLMIGGLGSLIALNALRLSSIDDRHWSIVLGLAVLLGAVLTWGYYRLKWIRTFLNVIGAAPVAILLFFLVLSPSSEVAWGIDQDPSSMSLSARVGEPAPVILVVFDEFPIASIIDARGEIMGDHFPGLAELSRDAIWFRNAVTTHQGTRNAVPSMLTGIVQAPNEKLPHFADYPSSLFTLLASDYDVRATETLTQLCPETVCLEGSRNTEETRERWTSLGKDVVIVSSHLFLPGDLREGLPPIDQNWGDFGTPSVVRPDNWSIRERMQEQLKDDRRKLVERFLAQLERPLQNDEFYFIHLPLPHGPWIHLADGTVYNAIRPGGEGNRWGSNAWLVEQAYQQHLLEVQYVDHIVGSIIHRLEESGSYDSSILIVTADHGIAVRPKEFRRLIRQGTVGDIAAVPLFIKPPDRSRGGIDDYRAQITDIVPTIAGLLDVDIPWAVDGIDLFGPARPGRSESTVVSPSTSVTFGVDGQEKFRVVDYHSKYFGDRGPFGLSPPGFEQALGQTVAVSGLEASGITVTIESSELYADVDPEADHLPILVSGTLDGPISSGGVLAVTIESKVVALTEIWEEESVQRFQVLVPPDEIGPGEVDFGFYMVREDDGDFIYSVIGRS